MRMYKELIIAFEETSYIIFLPAIEAYNRNPFPDHWFSCPLASIRTNKNASSQAHLRLLHNPGSGHCSHIPQRSIELKARKVE